MVHFCSVDIYLEKWFGMITLNGYLTNGFIKKTQKTPKEEIQIAKDRRKNFIERVMRNENIS